jgi:uncharacterized protein (TIGR03435 family)
MRAWTSAAVLLVFASGAFSQQPPSPDPAFEVASVKPNRSGLSSSGSTTRPGGGYVGTNLTLHQLVTEAYRLRPFQVIGGPGWIKIDRFDINARAPEGTTGRAEPMLRALLADRFTLRVHTETKEQQVYALVLARADGRLGPKLTPSTQECGPPARDSGPGSAPLGAVARSAEAPTRSPCGMNVNTSATSGTLTGIGQPLSRLATALAGFGVEGLVVDRTGLSGNFDIELQWTPEILRSAAAGGPGGDGPSLFTAMQEQLGLKLESTRGPVEYLVIDSAELPTPD